MLSSISSERSMIRLMGCLLRVSAAHRGAERVGRGHVERERVAVVCGFKHDAIGVARVLGTDEIVQHVLKHLLGWTLQRIAVAAARRREISRDVAGLDAEPRALGW